MENKEKQQCVMCGKNFRSNKKLKDKPDGICLECLKQLQFMKGKFFYKCSYCKDIFTVKHPSQKQFCPKCKELGKQESEKLDQLIPSIPKPIINIKDRIKKIRRLKLRFELLVKYNFTCQACGRSRANYPELTLHIDHLFPDSKGGMYDEKNLTVLCGDCNIGKGKRIYAEDVLLLLKGEKKE